MMDSQLLKTSVDQPQKKLKNIFYCLENMTLNLHLDATEKSGIP